MEESLKTKSGATMIANDAWQDFEVDGIVYDLNQRIAGQYRSGFFSFKDDSANGIDYNAAHQARFSGEFCDTCWLKYEQTRCGGYCKPHFGYSDPADIPTILSEQWASVQVAINSSWNLIREYYASINWSSLLWAYQVLGLAGTTTEVELPLLRLSEQIVVVPKLGQSSSTKTIELSKQDTTGPNSLDSWAAYPVLAHADSRPTIKFRLTHHMADLRPRLERYAPGYTPKKMPFAKRSSTAN